MAVLDKVKILLGFRKDDPEWIDSDLNDRLNLIIENAEAQVLSYLTGDAKKVPEALEYIVCEVSVARFNRIGNEGMTSYGQEGESIAYAENDISPYLSAIQAWNSRQDGNARGVVRLL